jgi:pyridoxal phosphate enzyme (YggS family)
MSVLTQLQLYDNVTHVRQTLDRTAQQFGRNSHEIQLLAVSKTRRVADIQLAIACGLLQFGENYVQEALPKIQALATFPNIVWHFIGPIQSNKTRLIAENFQWVQSVDSLKQAKRLHEQRPAHLPPLNICIQVNVSQEPQKSGILLNELVTFAQAVTRYSRLQLRGLMAIPAYHEEFSLQRQPCHTLYQAYQQLQTLGFQLDTLSMGMTDDMEAAIAEGTTMLRIGTGIFGERLPSQFVKPENL